GEVDLLCAHAGAVVGDADEVPAGVPELDADGAGVGVEGVLDELLHHRGRPLDDLAGGDLVHQVIWQPADADLAQRAPSLSRCCQAAIRLRAESGVSDPTSRW